MSFSLPLSLSRTPLRGLKPGLALLAIAAASAAFCQTDSSENRLLVKFRSPGSEFQSMALQAETGGRKLGQIEKIGVEIIELPRASSAKAIAHVLKQRPEIEFAEPDLRIPLTFTPNDPLITDKWHYGKIEAYTAWDTTLGSSGVTIAIVDSGVDGTHPDLQGRMVAGWNFSGGNSDTSDVLGHGTNVAGAAAATMNNAMGVAGVAGGCKLMPLRVADASGSASLSAIASAITYAADHGAKIVNASFAMVNSGTIDSAASYLMGKGGLYFMASGNSGTLVSGTNSPYVVTVGGTDINDLRRSFSTYGNWMDIVAPAVIYTTAKGGGYAWIGGTSSCTPIAAATAALALSANPGMTSSQLLQVLTSSSQDLGAAGWDIEYGWGRVNAYRAVQAALSMTADRTPPAVSFSSPAEGETISGTRTVFVSATDNVQVDSVSLYVNGVLKSTMVGTPYQWSWNTAGYANGAYTLTATARDTSGNTATATRNVTVSNSADTTPPTVSISSPTSGSRVPANLSVEVSANDNRGVTKVELYVDGALMATDTTSPWSFRMNTKNWKPGSHSLVARAYDAAGNNATSASVTVYK